MLTILGRIGRDVELRHTQNGDAVAGISLAYSYGRKGPDGNKPSQWVDATLWGKQAEALQPYLTKGKLIAVSLDDVHIEEYPKKDGTTGSKLAGRVVKIEFASSGDRPNGGGHAQAQGQAQGQYTQNHRAQAPRQQAAPQQMSQYDQQNNFDDDVPF